MKKLSIMIVFILISALLLSVPVSAGTNSKTFSGWSSDFGTKFWFVNTYITPGKTGSILNWSDVHAYNNSPLPPEMGNGDYYMSRLETHIGTSTQSFYSLGNVNGTYIWPSGKYWYLAGGVTQNLYGSGYEIGYFAFFNSGWQPLNDWSNSLNVSF